MAKLNPFSMARPKREPKTFTFTDPSQPDNPLTMRLKAIGPSAGLAAYDIQQELVAKWIEGEVPFPAIGGEACEVTRSLCQAAAAIYVMQCPEDPSDRYSPEEIIALSFTMESAFMQLNDAATKLAQMEQADFFPVVEGTSSGPSSSKPEDTQNSIPA